MVLLDINNPVMSSRIPGNWETSGHWGVVSAVSSAMDSWVLDAIPFHLTVAT